jgi:vacuolar-type H+-ATPase subunit H
LKEVVKKIMETENEVRGKVERAHEEAQKIVRSAEGKSRDIAEESRQNAIREGQRLVELLKKEAETERDLQVGKVRGGSEELVKRRAKEIERAVKEITKLVTGESD